MRKRPLFYFACVFLMGLVYQRYEALGMIGVLLAFIGVEVFYGVSYEKRKLAAGRSVILLSAFLLGAFQMYREESFRQTYLSKLNDGDRVTVWGEISKIEATNYGVRLYLSDCYVSFKEEEIPCNDVLVYTSSTYYQVGQIHKISGEFHNFIQARNEGNFDAKVFYQSQKIDFSIYAEEIIVMGFQENLLRDGLLSLREQMASVYTDCANEKTAGFLSAMLLGDKSSLDEVLKELFMAGGITHILAISGLHVSILGRGGYKLLRKSQFGFLSAGIMASMLLFCYSYLTGNGMSTVRAVGMLFLFFVGQFLGRSYDMLNALGTMCICLLWENPFLIEYSGFWFSVMALVGIGFVSDILSWETKRTAGLWSSAGISLATMPITAICYFEVPLYSVLVNTIVLPLLSPLFCLGVIGGLTGLVFPPLAQLMLFPCQWAVALFEWICIVVEKLPGATLLTGKPSVEQVIVYYSILLIAICLMRGYRKKWKEVKDRDKYIKIPQSWTVFKVVLGIVCLGILAFPKAHTFEISFLDVGQGDGIYLCMPDGTHLFIDGGSTDVNEVGNYRILPFLKSKQIGEIDYWFVSHADADHISGLQEVLEEGYSVGYLVVAEAAPHDDAFLELLALAEKNGTEVLVMSAGDVLSGKSWLIQCLHPVSDAEIEDKNNASLVLRLEMAMGMTALFAGDISSEVEKQLVEQGYLTNVLLYKVAHHGSKYSNSTDLLEKLCAEIAVISCGEENNYGHPHAECLERLEAVGCEIWTTLESGQVTIEIDASAGAEAELEVQGWLVSD